MTARPSRTAQADARIALAVLVVLLAAVVAIAGFAIVSLYRSAESRYVRQALPLRTATRDIVLQMVNQETGVRGYVITRDRASLRPYFSGRDGVANDVVALEELASGHPQLGTLVRRLRAEIRALNGWFAREIAYTADGREGQLRAQRDVLGGQSLFGDFRRTAAATAQIANRLVAETRAAQRRTYRRTLAGLAVGGGAALAIAIGLLVLVPRRLRRIYTQAELGANASRALEHIDEAVILLDEHGTIRFWSEGARDLFGVPPDEAVGVAATSVIPDLAHLEQTASSGRAVAPSVIRGEERWLRVAIASFDGGRVLTLRDVTHEEAFERTRADLVATASHELRTPVTVVYGAVQTLRRHPELGDAQRAELMDVIEDESARLARLLEQIMLTAELDRAEMTVEAEECDVYAVSAAVRAAADGGLVTLEAPAALAPVRTDAERLRQVLTSLVDNAIKYSPDGAPVRIRIEDSPERVAIAIHDEGIGIPPREQERIFEKFYRLDPAMTRGVGGLGLGLYVAREVVERLGGELTVASEPGRGSTFTVTLPRP